MKKYYEAYDDRYQQVHKENLRWFDDSPSDIVLQMMEKYSVGKQERILEIGCGEGRDARFLLKNGYQVLATDVSPAAIICCWQQDPEHENAYDCLDCLDCCDTETYDYIYAVAVIHMLVPQEDRDGFYRFYAEHLTEKGRGLICSMGDGTGAFHTDITTAFDTKERLHEASGKALQLANTSCRMVTAETFREEILSSGLKILEMGNTAVMPDFPEMIYAVVAK